MALILTTETGGLGITTESPSLLELTTELAGVLSILQYSTSILVNADTIYAECRIDHATRMMRFGRPAIVPGSAHPLAMMQTPRPSPTLFEERFVGVISQIQRMSYSDLGAPAPPWQRHLAFLMQPSTRLEEPSSESQFTRSNTSLLLFARNQQSAPGVAVQPYSFDFPDLCDPMWADPWNNSQIDHAARLFPFRQIQFSTPPPPPTSAPQTILTFYAAPKMWIEAEADRLRATDHALALFPFLQQQAFTPPSTLRVVALSQGFYNGETRNIGDVFDIPLADLALAATNFMVGIEGGPFFGWMKIVPPTTPLQINAPTPLNSANVPRTVF